MSHTNRNTEKKEHSLTIRLPETLYRYLEEAAGETDTSKSYHIRRALEVYFDESYVDAEAVVLREERGEKKEYSSSDEVRKRLGIPPRKKPITVLPVESFEDFAAAIKNAIDKTVDSYKSPLHVNHGESKIRKTSGKVVSKKSRARSAGNG